MYKGKKRKKYEAKEQVKTEICWFHEMKSTEKAIRSSKGFPSPSVWKLILLNLIPWRLLVIRALSSPSSLFLWKHHLMMALRSNSPAFHALQFEVWLNNFVVFFPFFLLFEEKQEKNAEFPCSRLYNVECRKMGSPEILDWQLC